MAHTSAIVVPAHSVANGAIGFTIRCCGAPETDTTHTIYVLPSDDEAAIAAKIEQCHKFTRDLHEAKLKAYSVIEQLQNSS